MSALTLPLLHSSLSVIRPSPRIANHYAFSHVDLSGRNLSSLLSQDENDPSSNEENQNNESDNPNEKDGKSGSEEVKSETVSPCPLLSYPD